MDYFGNVRAILNSMKKLRHLATVVLTTEIITLHANTIHCWVNTIQCWEKYHLLLSKYNGHPIYAHRYRLSFSSMNSAWNMKRTFIYWRSSYNKEKRNRIHFRMKRHRDDDPYMNDTYDTYDTYVSKRTAIEPKQTPKRSLEDDDETETRKRARLTKCADIVLKFPFLKDYIMNGKGKYNTVLVCDISDRLMMRRHHPESEKMKWYSSNRRLEHCSDVITMSHEAEIRSILPPLSRMVNQF